ncbi:MAG: tetratricopeptide repeat protein [Planctomycetota bacterium]|nr:MAG: tetratricopeptide repeat protein [Planctomycetota bacterium]
MKVVKQWDFFFLFLFFFLFMGCQSTFLLLGTTNSLEEPKAEAIGALSEAIYYSLRNKPYEAEQWIMKALQEDPNAYSLHFEAAKIYFQRNRTSEALQAMEKAVRLAPQNSPILLDIGEIYESRGYYSQALKIYISLLKQKRFTRYLVHRITQLLELLGKPQLSQYVYQEILPFLQDPSFKTKIQILLVRSLRMMGKAKEALDYLQQIPNTSEIQREKVLEEIYIYLNQSQNYKALETCYRGLKQYPNDLSLYYALAQIFERQKDLARARVVWKDLLSFVFQKKSQGPKLSLSEKYGLAGEIHIKLGNEEEGVRYLLKSLELNNTNKKSLLILKEYFFQKKDFLLAARFMESYLTRIPYDFEIKGELAYLYSIAGIHLDRAILYGTETLQAFPHHGKVLYAIGWAYLQKYEFQKALASLLQAHIYSPSLETCESLGYLFFCLGNLDDSEKWYERARKYAPHKESILSHLQWINQLKGEFRE